MTSFGAMNDRYYEPQDDRAWDYYVDQCSEDDVEPTGDGFEEWMEEQREIAEEHAAEAQMDRDRYGDDW